MIYSLAAIATMAFNIGFTNMAGNFSNLITLTTQPILHTLHYPAEEDDDTYLCYGYSLEFVLAPKVDDNTLFRLDLENVYLYRCYMYDDINYYSQTLVETYNPHLFLGWYDTLLFSDSSFISSNLGNYESESSVLYGQFGINLTISLNSNNYQTPTYYFGSWYYEHYIKFIDRYDYDLTNLVNTCNVLSGYSGDSESYNVGYANGLNTGLVKGQESGYNQGYDEGYTEGINIGYTDGYTNGFNEGSSIDDTAFTIFNGILNVAMIPINFFLAIFNFEILGINIKSLVMALLTISIIIIIWRVIMGGKSD